MKAASQGQSSWIWATTLAGSSWKGWRGCKYALTSWPPQTCAPSCNVSLLLCKWLPSQDWCYSYLPSRCDCAINIHEWNVVRSDVYLFWFWVDKKQMCLPPCSVPCLSVTEKDSEEARVIRWKEPGSLDDHGSKAACHTGTSALNFGIYEKKLHCFKPLKTWKFICYRTGLTQSLT